MRLIVNVFRLRNWTLGSFNRDPNWKHASATTIGIEPEINRPGHLLPFDTGQNREPFYQFLEFLPNGCLRRLFLISENEQLHAINHVRASYDSYTRFVMNPGH
ncbi:hypothetical protein TNCV_3052211 [Trichonephila clavipes]|nr:hypothetical protein TNCV_3052211 [Trichonephila clavipes]